MVRPRNFISIIDRKSEWLDITNMNKYDQSQFHLQALMLLVSSDSPKCVS